MQHQLRRFDSYPHLHLGMLKNFITEQLQHSTAYDLTPEDDSQIRKAGVEEFIFAKLTSKKFRKWALSPGMEEKVRTAIALQVQAGEPIQIRLPFGGYKLWRLPTAPEVDWAEFFAIGYYCQYVAPILAAYLPGVQFIFASDDIIVERMNNVPAEDTARYFNSFRQLLEQFRPFFPANFRMEIERIGDLFESDEDFERELRQLRQKIEKDYAQLEGESLLQSRAASEFNLQLEGAEDYSSLTTEARLQRADHGFILHEAYRMLERREEFNRGTSRIAVFPANTGKAVPIGSAKRSVVKFWVGIGALEDCGTDFAPHILSPQQYQQVLETRQLRETPVRILPGKNFEKILLFA